MQVYVLLVFCVICCVWCPIISVSALSLKRQKLTTTLMPATSKFTLKQFLNVPGLKALGLIFTQPAMILPSVHIPHVSALDLDALKAQGIECLVFDKDNTLT